VHFDDDALPVEKPDADAAARSAALNADPERQSLAALEFDALARQLASKGIAFGQTERTFVASMQQYYQLVRRAFEETLAAQRRHLEKTAAAAGTGDLSPPADPPAPPDGTEG
jgi:hypothetical protein